MRRYLILALLFTACARHKPLEVFGQVPAFDLTDQRGQKFDRTSLDGHVWVADFVFTNCEATCPRMTSKMKALQNATTPSLKLVSFTVDPDRDTPPVLAAYARRSGADTARWSFLTGEKSTLNMLAQDAFKLSAVGVDMDHSTRFVLIDRKGRIRGYYGIAEGDPIAKIAKDAARLEQEQG